MARSALDHLAIIFSDLILSDQDCFATEEGYESLLHLIPDTRVVDALRTKWSASSRSSEEKWMDLKTQVKKYDKGSVHRVRMSPSFAHTFSLTS